MTLVASFSIDKHPILIGDIMISCPSKGKSYKNFKIPTYYDVNRDVPEYLGYIVTGLKQKVIILNKYFSVAWAGAEIAAKTVIEELIEEFGDKGPTINELFNYFKNVDYLNGLQLYLTGIVVLQRHGEHTVLYRFAWDSDLGWNSNKYSTNELGDVYAGGSGRSDFEKLTDGMHMNLNVKTTPAVKAITASFSLISQLKGHQMRIGAGLSMLYGGGYELVTLLDGELKKIDDVIYHFWIVTRLENGKLNITFKETIKVAYHRDLLVIYKVNIFIHQENKEISTINYEVFVIPPIYRSVSETEKKELEKNIEQLSLNAKFSMFYIHVPQAGENNSVLNFAHYSGNKSPPVKYMFEKDDIVFEVSPNLIDRISTGVNRLLA